MCRITCCETEISYFLLMKTITIKEALTQIEKVMQLAI